MIKSFVSCSIILLCTVIFESAVLSNLTFLPAIPDIPLLCVLYFSINNGKILGETTGFLSGLLLDFLSACPLGLNTLVRSLIGYTGGIFNKEINSSGFIIPFVLGISVTIIKIFIVKVISLLFPTIVFSYVILSYDFLFEIIFNAFFCPIVFKILNIFRKSICIEPETYY